MTSPTTDLSPARITMYGADWCGDCRRSKALLDRRGVDYDYIDLEREVEAA
ncbi:MAG: NrdH-redoxin, partial [Agromyces sp.]|nr:NrdH-redoxin [Agromyces sp.]